jgi:ATP-dependent DNA helicase PIF1
MELSAEQNLALDKFKQGENMFLTGPGGSGKTELIKRMVKSGEEKGKKVQVCALTGCAAVLLCCKAKTVHSFAGIGLANGTVDEVVRKVISNKYKLKNWLAIDTLIVDEVSMMSVKLFEILDYIARKSRKKLTIPFGGIQVIFSGDFYQLPPVGTVGEDNTNMFCFESPNWEKTFSTTIVLKTIFRQTDQIYTGILNQVRVGKLYKSAYELLQKQVNKPFPPDFKPTILLPRRKDAEQINLTEINNLKGEGKKYRISKAINADEMKGTGGGHNRANYVNLKNSNINNKNSNNSNMNSVSTPTEEQIENEYNFLVNNIMAEKEIELKIGTQVMCIANIDMESSDQIVNGSQGVIVEFIGELPVVQFKNGPKRTVGYHVWSSETFPTVGVKQMPLIYAWAITIHKSQGVTLDMAQIDAGSNIFECGQTYVALSRVKSIDGLYLTDLNPQKIQVNKKVKEFYTKN